MPNLQKLVFPLMVFAAVIAVYIFFRQQGSANTTVTYPSTASSGVPASYTGAGVVQPVTYSVPAQAANPNNVVVLSNPYNTNPGGSPIQTPAYLSGNLGAGNLLNNAPVTNPNATPAANCGCGSGCGSCANQCGATGSGGTSANFGDGVGTTQMYTTRKNQIAASDAQSWLPGAVQNLNSYLAVEQTGSGGPSLTSWMPGGMIQ
jgi:hypothetical protein